MIRIGIIREGKIPADSRTPFSPKQCSEIESQYPEVKFIVQPSPVRCFNDEEYAAQGITLNEDLSTCNLLFGVKEVPPDMLLNGKTYLFFSHTKKKQPHNQPLIKALLAKQIRMIDYECLTHDDGHRVIGFGYWAGVVGAHNGLMEYGKRTQTFQLSPVHKMKNFLELKESYEGFYVPPIKIVLTGSGRVSTGVLDILNYLDITEVTPEDFLSRRYDYPVFTHLKGKDLYRNKVTHDYHRDDFHAKPSDYECLFMNYASECDILMNGVYWDQQVPRLFELTDLSSEKFSVQVIADITCDENGSVPCNVGSTTISDPTYGYDKFALIRTAPFQNLPQTIDIMAVDNLPNELPRDASKYFGGYLHTYVLPDLIKNNRTAMIERATICENGQLSAYYQYLSDYALGPTYA